MLTLHQLPISHFCEKIRWALSHKRLDHRTRNYLPGQHAIAMKRLGLQRTSLPVLQNDDKLIQNSSDIITHLDAEFPDRPLTPTEPALAQEAIEWEAWADERIGPHVRRICYHHLLQYPDTVIPLLSHGGPWYGSFLLKWTFPKLQDVMRKGMKIDASSVEASEKIVDEALEKLNSRLSEREHLVGTTFSRADLAAAALLAPMRMPEGYGIPWPKPLPEPLTAVLERYEDRLSWVDRTYAQHR